MAGYSTSNPPQLVLQGVGGGAFRLWFYSSVDAGTVVDGSGYFTNGYALGMRAGDSVLVLDNDASPPAKTIHTVASATSATVDLSDGVAVGSTAGD